MLCLTAAALLVFLTAAAGTGIVGVDLVFGILNGSLGKGIIPVGAGDLGSLLTLHGIAHSDPHKDLNGLLLDVLGHLLEHIVSRGLVLLNGILLGIGHKTDTVTKLYHVVDMYHPLAVDGLKKNDTLQLSYELGLREFGFFGFVELNGFFL